jgi:hypothetical protein
MRHDIGCGRTAVADDCAVARHVRDREEVRLPLNGAAAVNRCNIRRRRKQCRQLLTQRDNKLTASETDQGADRIQQRLKPRPEKSHAAFTLTLSG